MKQLAVRVKQYYHARNSIKNIILYVSVSQGDIHTKFTWQKFNKNILETDLLNLSNPEKSVVSAGKLFRMLTIQYIRPRPISMTYIASSRVVVEYVDVDRPTFTT